MDIQPRNKSRNSAPYRYAPAHQQIIKNKTHDITYPLVRERPEIQKLRQKTKYDKHTVNWQFLVGDLVWIQIPKPHIDNTTISHTLRPKYHGPCRLIEQLSPSTFIVLRLSDNVNLGATNIDRMKPYYEPQPETNPIPLIQDTTDPPLIRRYPLRNRRLPQTY